MPATSARRWTLRLALAVSAVLVADRAAMVALVDDDGLLQKKALAPFETATLQSGLADAIARLRADGTAGLYEVVFDPELGWETRHDPDGDPPRIDVFGARSTGSPRAAERAEGTRRILTFGCSFTYGSEVEGHEAWPARLDALRDDVEVFNFGVPAYGLGQALMRIERVAPALEPDEIWLVLMPSAARRPTTHLYTLVRPWTGNPWFKPRFDVDAEGALVRHANPVRSVEATVAAYDTPGVLRDLLAGNDPWYDRMPRAFERRPEHLLFAARVYWTRRFFRTPAETRGVDGAGNSLVPLHRAIALEARARATEMGAAFRYVILPGAYDLPPPDGDGGVITGSLVQTLRAEGVEVLDATPTILGVPGPERWASGGHYTPRANDAVARWLAGL